MASGKPLSQGAMSGFLFNRTTEPAFAGGTKYPLALQSLNASLSNDIYSKSSTVQPNSMIIQYLIKY